MTNQSQVDRPLPGPLEELRKDREQDFLIPPPAFLTMEGEFIDLDLAEGWLAAKFPVKRDFLNPYRSLQGGFTAAAIDNTIGPLSMLVAPPNLTRRLEITYSEAATLSTKIILVKAFFVKREGPWIYFKAEVRDPAGSRLARAKATHWILDQEV